MKNKKNKASDLLRKAEQELNKYKSTKNFTYSSQAAEKCWVACNLIIERKLNIELRTGSIRKITPYAEKADMGEITSQCFNLHVYHYEGSQAWTEEDLIYMIRSAISKLSQANVA